MRTLVLLSSALTFNCSNCSSSITSLYWTAMNETYLVRPGFRSFKRNQVAEEERSHNPGSGGKSKVFCPLSSPWIETERWNPLVNGNRNGSNEQCRKDGCPEKSREGNQKRNQWDGILMHSTEGQAGDTRVKERDGVIDHLQWRERNRKACQFTLIECHMKSEQNGIRYDIVDIVS